MTAIPAGGDMNGGGGGSRYGRYNEYDRYERRGGKKTTA